MPYGYTVNKLLYWDTKYVGFKVHRNDDEDAIYDLRIPREKLTVDPDTFTYVGAKKKMGDIDCTHPGRGHLDGIIEIVNNLFDNQCIMYRYTHKNVEEWWSKRNASHRKIKYKLRIMYQSLKGLSCAHNIGKICHGNINISSIRVDYQDNFVL